MPKFLADGKEKCVLLATRPADIYAITSTEANAGDDASCTILSPMNLGPSDSDTIAAKALCDQGNAEAFGADNFSGRNIVVFRYYDASTLQSDAATDTTWLAAYRKGTTLRTLTRLSAKPSSADFSDGDEYRYIEWTTDNPQIERGDDYIKATIPLAYAGTAALDYLIDDGSSS